MNDESRPEAAPAITIPSDACIIPDSAETTLYCARCGYHGAAGGHTCVLRGAAFFRRYATGLAVSGNWEPWAHFADTAWHELTRQSETATSSSAWKAARAKALRELDELGLKALVWRTDDVVDLAEHDAALAGLVVVLSDSADWPTVPGINPDILDSRHDWARYQAAMLSRHGLVDARQLLPSGLRQFCGQLRGGSDPDWTDHARVWFDRAGDPVLSVEPYNHTDYPEMLLAEIRVHLAAEGLPLVAEGPHPGVWNEGTTLVFLRHDGDVAVLLASGDR